MDEKGTAEPAFPLWGRVSSRMDFKGGSPGWMRSNRLHLPAHGKHFAIFLSVELQD